MCREVAIPELAAQIPGILRIQMWVCDLAMGRSLTYEKEVRHVSGVI